MLSVAAARVGPLRRTPHLLALSGSVLGHRPSTHVAEVVRAAALPGSDALSANRVSVEIVATTSESCRRFGYQAFLVIGCQAYLVVPAQR